MRLGTGCRTAGCSSSTTAPARCSSREASKRVDRSGAASVLDHEPRRGHGALILSSVAVCPRAHHERPPVARPRPRPAGSTRGHLARGDRADGNSWPSRCWGTSTSTPVSSRSPFRSPAGTRPSGRRRASSPAGRPLCSASPTTRVRWIGHQRWRKLHRLTAAAWLLGLVHSLGEGTDAGRLWFLAMVGIVVVPAAALLLARASRPRAAAPEAVHTSA